MKTQDILFIIVLTFLILFKRAKYTWHAGILCFLFSGALFLIGNLFTAQRLAWYGAGFITITVIRALTSPHQKN